MKWRDYSILITFKRALCHCHLHSAVVEIDKACLHVENEEKHETPVVHVPLSLTSCRSKDICSLVM